MAPGLAEMLRVVMEVEQPQLLVVEEEVICGRTVCLALAVEVVRVRDLVVEEVQKECGSL
jgi:hypothetical protein